MNRVALVSATSLRRALKVNRSALHEISFHQAAAAVPLMRQRELFQKQAFSSRRGRRGNRGTLVADAQPSTSAPAPARRLEEAWVAVTDDASNQTYWWNQVTNETTAVGAPRPETGYLAQSPLHSQQATTVYQQQAPQSGGLGQTLKEGFAFGAGAGIARGVIGSMFGGFGGGGSSGGDDGDGGGGGGDGWV